jgi:hypothetical protein
MTYGEYNYSSTISYKYSGSPINIFSDIEREIRLLIKKNLSVENYIKTIQSNNSLEEINKSLVEVINNKFPQYSCILKQC